jgi:hypothetical protein
MADTPLSSLITDDRGPATKAYRGGALITRTGKLKGATARGRIGHAVKSSGIDRGPHDSE